MDTVQHYLEQQVRVCKSCQELVARNQYPIYDNYRATICGEHAELRAWHLLWTHLTPTQQYTFWKTGAFIAVADKRHAPWIVTANYSSGLFELSKGGTRVLRQCCAITQNTVPLGDMLLAQKFWIETQPDGPRRVALGQRWADGGLLFARGRFTLGYPRHRMRTLLYLYDSEPPRPGRMDATSQQLLTVLVGGK